MTVRLQLRTIALAMLMVAGLPAMAREPRGFAWPGGHRAAVSLSYDDALDSQLDIAIPALDRHGFRGSFYLQLSRGPVLARMDEWRAAARRGHELGNHSLFHQCSASKPGREWVQPEHDLDHVTVAQMRDQVLLANAMLHAIDGRDTRTYTVPCGDSVAADGDYLPAVRDAFVAIKSGEGAVTPDMGALDAYAVTVGTPVGASGAEMIARVEEAARLGTMVNFTFHGVGGDYLETSAEAHEQLLDYLAAHRDTYWVAPFVEIMQAVRGRDGRATGTER